MMFLVSGDLQLSSLSLSSVIQEKINYEESNGQKRLAIQLSLEQGDWDHAQTNSPLLRGKGEERRWGGGVPSPEQTLETREEMLKDDGEGREGVAFVVWASNQRLSPQELAVTRSCCPKYQDKGRGTQGVSNQI